MSLTFRTGGIVWFFTITQVKKNCSNFYLTKKHVPVSSIFPSILHKMSFQSFIDINGDKRISFFVLIFLKHIYFRLKEPDKNAKRKFCSLLSRRVKKIHVSALKSKGNEWQVDLWTLFNLILHTPTPAKKDISLIFLFKIDSKKKRKKVHQSW